MADIKKIKIGETTYDLRDASALRDDLQIKNISDYDALIKEYILSKLLENNSANMFVGTMAEYQTANAAGNIPVGCIVYITDDSVDTESSDATSAILGVAVLDSMILG